jgi:hypothetical protein
MADERLLSIDEFLLQLIVTAMGDGRAMTAGEIAKAASKSSARKVDRRSVEAILTPLAGGLVMLTGVPPRRVIRQRRRGLFQRGTRWRLVDEPASPTDSADAPVPAWPYRPTLSGAAAAPLMFREDEPLTDAIGKPA